MWGRSSPFSARWESAPIWSGDSSQTLKRKVKGSKGSSSRRLNLQPRCLDLSFKAARKRDKSFLQISDELTCMISRMKTLFFFPNFTSRLTLRHLGISIMGFEWIWIWTGFSSTAAVTVRDVCVWCPHLLLSQRRQPSRRSYPDWWRQWWGWPLVYDPAREEGGQTELRHDGIFEYLYVAFKHVYIIDYI